jgi:hypothetical protein
LIENSIEPDEWVLECVVWQAELIAGGRFLAAKVEHDLVDPDGRVSILLVEDAEIDFEISVLAEEVEGFARRRLSPGLELFEAELPGLSDLSSSSCLGRSQSTSSCGRVTVPASRASSA